MSIEKCEVCERARQEQGNYCRYHSIAYSNLNEKYPDWKAAYGGMSWERYLETIMALEETGDWVKQVAKKELSNGTSPVKT
jgi:hypothetical protein